jgi:hypothetical protein
MQALGEALDITGRLQIRDLLTALKLPPLPQNLATQDIPGRLSRHRVVARLPDLRAFRTEEGVINLNAAPPGVRQVGEGIPQLLDIPVPRQTSSYTVDKYDVLGEFRGNSNFMVAATPIDIWMYVNALPVERYNLEPGDVLINIFSNDDGWEALFINPTPGTEAVVVAYFL